MISSNPTEPRHDWEFRHAPLDFSPKWRLVTRVFVLPLSARPAREVQRRLPRALIGQSGEKKRGTGAAAAAGLQKKVVPLRQRTARACT